MRVFVMRYPNQVKDLLKQARKIRRKARAERGGKDRRTVPQQEEGEKPGDDNETERHKHNLAHHQPSTDKLHRGHPTDPRPVARSM